MKDEKSMEVSEKVCVTTDVVKSDGAYNVGVLSETSCGDIYSVVLEIGWNLKIPGRKCLIIDDSQFTRMGIIQALVKAGLFEPSDILEAHDGLEGIRKFRDNLQSLDIVICDVQMKNFDGEKFVRSVRSLVESIKKEGDVKTSILADIIPIIIITGTAPYSKVEFLEIGAKDFVFKPSREISADMFEKEIIARAKIHLILKRTQEKLLEMSEYLYKVSIVDPLTGVFNRRYMNSVLGQEFSRATRKSSPIAVIIFDLDNFKSINDSYGHLVGDQILKEFALLLVQTKREYDYVFRYGGDEFLVLLPESRQDGIVSFWERLIKLLDGKFIDCGGGKLKLSFSAGAAVFPSQHIKGLDDLIKSADKSLYKAKSKGKNSIEIAT